jgi:hypothetical protein
MADARRDDESAGCVIAFPQILTVNSGLAADHILSLTCG